MYTTKYGVDKQQLSSFDGKTICIKRGAKNYHDISKIRNKTCPATYNMCGPQNDIERSFCVSGEVCPLNDFRILPASNATNTTLTNDKLNYRGSSYNSTHTMYEILNRPLRNPIANLYIGLSPPCGSRKSEYMKRPNTLD